MTREKTGKLLDEIVALYPNLIRGGSDMLLMGRMWDESLQDQEYETMHNALILYFKADTKGYVPTAGQLIEIAEREVSDPLRPADHEYWGNE